MYDWVPFSQTLDHAGMPRQFFNKEGEVFLLCLNRVSGPSDTTIPRRVVGMGETRALALSAVIASMRAYDPTGTIISSS